MKKNTTMKKTLIFIFLFMPIAIFAQLDTTYIGTGPNTGTGESPYTAFQKVNKAIKFINDSVVKHSDTTDVIATRHDLDRIDSKLEMIRDQEFWVSYLSGDDGTGNGSRNYPYKTIQKVIDLHGSNSNHKVIYVDHSTTEDLTFNNVQNITIVGVGVLDSQQSSIVGNHKVTGTSTRIRFKDIILTDVADTFLIEYNGSAGRHYNQNTSFMTGDNGYAVGFLGAEDRWHEFYDCYIGGSVYCNSSDASMSAKFTRQLAGEFNLKINTFCSVNVYDAQRFDQISHTSGKLYINGLYEFWRTTDNQGIVSTATNASGSYLELKNTKMRNTDNTYMLINKTGDCDYLLSNVSRDAANDVLTGTQILSDNDEDIANTSNVTGNSIKDALDNVLQDSDTNSFLVTNYNLFSNPLSIKSGNIQLGNTDAYSRIQIWNKSTNSILRLGSWQSDGDATNIISEGIVVYTSCPWTGNLSVSDGAYARIKGDRMGLYTASSGGLSNYYFRADTAGLYLRKTDGSKAFETKRWNGETYSDKYYMYSLDDTTSSTDLQLMPKRWILDNIGSGGSSLPSGIQGDILYHNGSNWVVLNAGTNGYYLKTQGTAANPVWSSTPTSIPDTIFVSGQNEWVGLNDTITKVDSSNLALNSDNLNSQNGSYYLDRGNHTGTQNINSITGLQDSLNLFLEIEDTVKFLITDYDLSQLTKIDSSDFALNADSLNSQASAYYLNRTNHTGEQTISTITGLQDSLNLFLEIEDTILIIATKYDLDTTQFFDSLYINNTLRFNIGSESQETTKSINFTEKQFFKIDVSATMTINVTGYPIDGYGVYNLMIDNTNGSTVNIGTGWGTAADNTSSISTTSGSKTLVQFVYDGEDLTYMVLTRGN